MNHIVSVTLIPVAGSNVKLDKELFLGNFIDSAEEALDALPVGCAIEIVYDHIDTYSDGSFKKAQHLCCIVCQKERGIFTKNITTIPMSKSVTPGRYLFNLKRKYLKNKPVE